MFEQKNTNRPHQEDTEKCPKTHTQHNYAKIKYGSRLPKNKQDGITSGLRNIREKCLQQQVINIYNLFFVSNAFHPPVRSITKQWKIIDSLAKLLQNKLIKPFLALLLYRSHFHLPFFPYSLIQCSFFPPSTDIDHFYVRVTGSYF